MPMKPLNNLLRRHPHRRNKQPRATLNNDIHQLVQLTPRVIVVRLARPAANLRQREVYAKG